MFFIFRLYTYSPLATLISILGTFGSFAAAAGALFCFMDAKQGAGHIAGGIFFAALAVFLFFFVGRRCADKAAAVFGERNIRRKAGYAKSYCREHPEAYEMLIAENPAFAEKYIRSSDGKKVRRKQHSIQNSER